MLQMHKNYYYVYLLLFWIVGSSIDIIPEYHCDTLFYQAYRYAGIILCISVSLDCEIEWLSNAI